MAVVKIILYIIDFINRDSDEDQEKTTCALSFDFKAS